MDEIFGLKFHFWLKHSPQFFFEILICGKAFLDPLIYFIKVKNFAQNDKFSNKNDMYPLVKEFQKKNAITISETLSQKFHPYSILS